MFLVPDPQHGHVWLPDFFRVYAGSYMQDKEFFIKKGLRYERKNFRDACGNL